MKVAIYLGNASGDYVSGSSVEYGNPGVGGTQYEMMLLAHFLNKKHIDTIVLANRTIGGGITIIMSKILRNCCHFA